MRDMALSNSGLGCMVFPMVSIGQESPKDTKLFSRQ